MKVRRKKLLAVLICVALSVTDILPVGFSVYASELGQPNLAVENDEETADNGDEKEETERESTDKAGLLEESVGTEDEETKRTENKIEIQKEELEVEKEETKTKVQEIENGDDSTEIGTQVESSITEEMENDNTESDTSEEKTEQEFNVTTSGENIASGSYKDITWVIDSERKLTVTGTGDFMEDRKSPWYGYRNYVVSAEINVTGAVDASYMFYDHPNLTYVNMSNFDTVTDMKYMFENCNYLTSVDLGSFNTSNVTDMRCMFRDCWSLTNLDVSGFDTKNVTNMSCMFRDCGGLANLDVSGFDTKNVTNMWGMFENCDSLTNLDVSSFDTKNVTDMSCMFRDCGGLTNLDVSGFDTKNVTNMWGMFEDCDSLTNLDVSKFDISHVTDMSYMFADCSSLTSIDLRGFNVGIVEEMDSIFSDCFKLTTIYTPYNVTQFVSLPIADAEVWYKPDGTAIIELPQNLSYSIMLTKKPTVSDDNIISGSYRGITWMIDANGKLTVIGKGDFFDDYIKVPWYAYKDTIISAQIKVTDMHDGKDRDSADISNMFCYYSNLESVDLSGFDTKRVSNMSCMFFGCSSLKSVDLSSFDTRRVTDMSGMFAGCSNLTSVDLSSFHTENVTNLNTMFSECSSLMSVDVSGFNTENVTDMSCMFWYCKSLTSVDLSSFDTRNVIYMDSMFGECNSLTSIDVKGFDITNVVQMSNMFGNCSKLTYIDLSNFDLRNFEDENGEKKKVADGILDGCINLATIHTPYNLSQSVSLPKAESGDIWYQSDGTAITELPQNLDFSVIITKNSIPAISEPYITAKKDKTFYECGDVLNLSDLKVICHNVDGTVKEVNDFSTNKDEIDMSTAGSKTLKIIYNNLETTIKLYVKQNIVSGSYEGITWVINSKGKLIVKGTGDFAEPSANAYKEDRAPWYIYEDLIKSAEIDVTGMTDASYMFNICYNLESIEFKRFDTESITNMNYMFSHCESLTSVDVSKFDTKNVTDMNSMFYRCLDLKNIDVSGFDTSKVKNMASMFGECYSLLNLDVSGFDTSKVTSMGSMFWDCFDLTSLDVSGFDTGKVTYMDYMFAGCTSLTSLDMSGFDTKKVTDMGSMFWAVTWQGCGVTSIYTPCNVVDFVPLPPGNWYQPDGTIITELPKNLPYSILITKNTIPTVSTPHIVANKAKKIYTCADTLNIDDLTVRFYNTDGTVKTVTDYTTNADTIDMTTTGTKTLIITYNSLTAEINLTVTATQQEKTYTVTFDLGGHGEEIAPLTNIIAGNLIAEPTPPTAQGYQFIGWYKDSAYTDAWDFNTDTIQQNITLYAYWITVEDSTQIGNLSIQKIPTQSYTGSAIKPNVTVYCQSAKGKTQLKAGTDYTVKYYNNIQADNETEQTLGGTSQTENGNGFTKELAYVVITCKGNYTGTVYQNFHIAPVSIVDSEQNTAKGFTLSCIDQLITGNKALKPFGSLKYKKAMKVGTDYTIKLTAQKAYDADGNALAEGSVIDANNQIPTIPTGYRGTFQMTITGINNYKGIITKTIYVTDKNHLMKNASVTLGKNQKNMQYTGGAVALTPAWYDASTEEYFAISDDGGRTEADKSNVFTVKFGTEYLLYGKDFKISYGNNQAVGTATMTITGIGDYIGTKNVTFRINGTPFKAKNIEISNFTPSLTYTGRELTQNEVVLTDISDDQTKTLVYGTDYTIAYKNNTKKGSATMTFTAKPISGYSGSFKKTFKIASAELSEITAVTVAAPYHDAIITQNGYFQLDGKIIYTKEGAKPSERIVLTNQNTGSILKEGTDYTVSYADNKAVTTGSSLAEMTIKGKGNYAGDITISFPIMEASLSENDNLTVTTASIAYSAEKAEDYQYQPSIKITDKKKALSASKDYRIVEYKNCSQTAVTAYLEALGNGTALPSARPYAIVQAIEGSGYEGSLEVDLIIYQTKLTAKNLYIVVSEQTAQVTYTGKQVKPEVTVYYGEPEAVKQAKDTGETKQLTKLNPRENGTGDYTLSYGTNITAGKNKGSVTVNGAGLYGGEVTVKFTILGKDVYNTAE